MKLINSLKTAAAIALAAAVIAAPVSAFAANTEDITAAQQTAADQTTEQKGPMGGNFGGMGQSGGNYADSPSEIVTSTLTQNSAESLAVNTANAQTIVMSASNSEIKISKAGTYIITGTCSNGSITVKKGTTGVVLILKDLDLTSTSSATLSLNKGTEVKVVIQGTVSLTDAEDIANEDTDDFDGAAIKAKAGSSVVLTGDGTLNVKGSCKNGIKVSDLDDDDKADGYTEASFIIDGKDLTIDITAANDGINSGTDFTIKAGNINVSAGDDGIHADYILTIGEEDTDGPTINVRKSNEGLEGATINIYSGTIDVTASDDGINAANGDLTGYTYSLNIMGGTINISAGADGIDSNGNVNITGGLTTIVKSASNGGEGGLDYNGTCYIADGTFVNPYGTTMDSGMGGMMGGRGQMQWGGQRDQSGNSDQTPQPGGQDSEIPEMPNFGDWDGEIPDFDGEMPEMPGGFPGFGNWGGQGGQMPQFGDNNGQMPQFGGRDQTDGRRGPQNGQFPTDGQNGQMPWGDWDEEMKQKPDAEIPEWPGMGDKIQGEPGMDGELSEGRSGELPDGNSSATPEKGDPQRPDGKTFETPDGKTPETPENIVPQTPDNTSEGQPSENTESEDAEENLSWFAKLIRTIKRWLSISFN